MNYDINLHYTHLNHAHIATHTQRGDTFNTKDFNIYFE